ncbi:LPS translocon maturation chaperone LptM [Maricaulis sp.]|uniref:LPS translocon maturation chaperone LptM n=1 Tax=Maricaulis sp. TaxID=1486257 RepID=UPI003A8EF346
MMKRLSSLTLILLVTSVLGACGLRGDLERPEPMWGHPQDAEAPGGTADEPAAAPTGD